MSWPFLFLYYPLLKLAYFLFFWLPEVQLRKKFEEKNLVEPLARSFKEQGLTADICFEFSSEGEYQQVASLVDDALDSGKKVELVFFSPSVEKSILDLANRYSSQIRYLRFPLVKFCPYRKGRSFTRWVTARRLVLVRYDLFPEFLIWAKLQHHELIMVWVSFKKERSKGKSVSSFKQAFLKSCSKIVFASGPDQGVGQDLGLTGKSYDFRMEQIRRRVSLREEKLERTFGPYKEIRKIMALFPREKRIIVGNAWPSDLFLLRDLPEDYFLMVVPHQVSPEILRAFHTGLTRLGRESVEVTDTSTALEGDTFLINKKGVLCELYSDFGLAYVGGGFEVGVHSLLEPLVAGSDSLASGPMHQRSTEFDVAHGLDKIIEVKTPEAFRTWLEQAPAGDPSHALRGVFERYAELRKEVISC